MPSFFGRRRRRAGHGADHASSANADNRAAGRPSFCNPAICPSRRTPEPLEPRRFAGTSETKPREGLPSSFAVGRQRPVMAGSALGTFCGAVSQGTWRSLRERLSVKSIPRNPTAKQPAPPGHERLAWRTDTLRLNPRPHPRRCRRRPDWPPRVAYGSDRPRAFDRRRCRRATAHASRARSPCRPISR
jgi:hypothetical protein